MDIGSIKEQKEEDTPPSSPPPRNIQLSMLTGPKMYISVQFMPCEYKPYTLSCFVDSGCQVNLAKGSTIPHFYWE